MDRRAPDVDFTDLHAWCEVYLPGAGWIGLDPTSGLLTGESHIPLPRRRTIARGADIGRVGQPGRGGVRLRHEGAPHLAEHPRITKPFSDESWAALDALGEKVDAALKAGDVRLTMGGEPTFVSIDDFESPSGTPRRWGPPSARWPTR
jgi:hypothetical protein